VSYDEVAKGEFVTLIGSTGLLEVAINNGNAASVLKAQKGSRVIFSRN
jgi:S-adenosylmethionine hydrolase